MSVIKNKFISNFRVFWILDKRIKLFFTVAFYAFVLAGCAANYAPVEHRNGTSYSVKKKHSGKTPVYYRVKKGDTLYSIAWLYGLDYKAIAYKNSIKSPYRIYAGDRLRLQSSSSKKAAYTKEIKVSANKNRKTSNSKAKSYTKRKTSVSKKRTTTKNYNRNKTLKWRWPVKGKVIQHYSPGSGKKGIDISAAKGTLIKSAEAGKVVYSGQGLVGYGRLIIIKHNDNFLSAYAHNQELLVNEGQEIKKGQSIARLGRSGTDRYKLHFEIRKNGKPVNPVSYLPH